MLYIIFYLHHLHDHYQSCCSVDIQKTTFFYYILISTEMYVCQHCGLMFRLLTCTRIISTQLTWTIYSSYSKMCLFAFFILLIFDSLIISIHIRQVLQKSISKDITTVSKVLFAGIQALFVFSSLVLHNHFLITVMLMQAGN